MIVARAYRLPLTVILAWSALDVLVAAWSHARAEHSAQYRHHTLALYSGHLTAAAFNAPERLADAQQELSAQAPAWERADVTPIASGTMDDLFALMGRPPE